MGANGETWARTKVENLAEYVTVGFVGSMSSLFVEDCVPLLRGQNIHPYSLDLTNLKYISQETHRKWKKSALKPGDVVIVRVGYPGTACVIPEGVGELNAASLVIVRPNPALLDSKYLSYVVNSPWGKAQVAGRLVGSAQQVFNTQTAAELEIPAPPLLVQRRIAGILSAYDELMENSQRRIRLLEAMARALYREWFVHFRFPGHEKVKLVRPPSRPGEASAKTDGDIPQGWEVKKLADVAEVNRAQINARTAPEELHYIDISSVSPGQIDSITTYAFADAPGRARRIVQHGDVLWSCVRPNRRSHAQVMHPEPDTIASTGFAVLTATKVPFTFLYFATTTDDFVALLTNNATGAAYPAVSGATFEKADLLIPPASLLKKFGAATIPMAEQIHALHRKIQNLRRTRDLLLSRLLSGQVELKTEAA
jgi:type I restriction enzyme S subunit